MATVFRPPLSTRREPLRSRLDWSQPTPLTLRSVVVSKPFSQTDWPVPRGSKSYVHPVQGIALTLRPVAAVQSPFGLTDFPNPQRRKSVLQEFQANTLPLNSITYVNMPFGAQWENPKPKPIVPVKVDVNTIGMLTQTFAQMPFGAQWDNPWRRIFSPPPVAVGGTLGLETLYVDRVPTVFRLARTARLDPSFNTSASLALTGPQGPKPFLQSQWPNPLPQKWWRFDHQQAGCSVALLTPITKPFNFNDWQNPLPARWWRIDHSQAGCSLALVTPPTKPFNLNQWPNPVIQLRAQQPQILPLPLTFPAPVVTPPDPSGPPADPAVIPPSSGGKHEDEKRHHPRGMLLPQKKKAGQKRLDDIELVVKPEQTQIAKAVGAIDARSFYVEPPKPLTPMERLEARVAELEVMVAKSIAKTEPVEEEMINDDEEAMAVILKALYE